MKIDNIEKAIDGMMEAEDLPEIPKLKPITTKLRKFTAPELVGASSTSIEDAALELGKAWIENSWESWAPEQKEEAQENLVVDKVRDVSEDAVDIILTTEVETSEGKVGSRIRVSVNEVTFS